MKVDEILKRLENVKTDEDEKRKIAEYIAQVMGFDDLQYKYNSIITKDKTIYNFHSYVKLLKSNEISPNDAYVYVDNDDYTSYDPVAYLYPFLRYGSQKSLVNAYLSKLGFSSLYTVPATGLRYIAIVVRIRDVGLMSVEVVDIGTAAINTNLPTITRGILITKYVDKHVDFKEVKDIILRLDFQKLFNGYYFGEAWRILYRYYEKHDTSLAKDVEAIKDAYNRIFQPYHIEFDLKTKQPISSNK